MTKHPRFIKNHSSNPSRARQTRAHTRALLDEGWTVTMIDIKIAHLIDVKGSKSTINLRGIRDEIGVKIEA